MAIQLTEKQMTNGWRIVRLKDVAFEVKRKCIKPLSSRLKWCVRGEHFDTQSIRFLKRGSIKEAGPTFNKHFLPGEFLYITRNPHLKKGSIADFEGITANTTLVLDVISDCGLIKELFPFIMQSDSFHDYAYSVRVGSTNYYTKWVNLKEFEFALPPIKTQKNILEVVHKVEKCKQLLFQCEQYTHTLYSQLLLKTFPNYWEINSKSYKNLPVGWKKIELGKLLIDAPESGYSANEVSENSGFYVLNLNCLSSSGFVNNGYKSITEKDFLMGKEVMDGDFLISRSNTKELVGAVGICVVKNKRAIFPDTMWRLNLKKDLILPEFLESYLLSPYGRRQLVRIAAGTSGSMVKINKQSLKKLPVPVPFMSIQQQIVIAMRILKNNWRTIENHRNNYLKLRQSIFNEEILNCTSMR